MQPDTQHAPIAGFLNIDKPSGMTSFDVVRAVRRAAHIKRVGHAGTLDPLATGVLPVAIGGEATRLVDAFVGAAKAYTAEVTLGIETDTDDAEGTPVASAPAGAVAALTTEVIADALTTFEGAQLQFPPAYSAIKRGGIPAYRAARAGDPLALDARAVIAHALRLVAHEGALLRIEVECGKGYYVRSLARDLGRLLGVGGHISALRRTRVGPFTVAHATPLAEAVARLEARADLDTLLHAPDAVLDGWPVVLLGADDEAAVAQGKIVAPSTLRAAAEDTRARVYGESGHLLALAEACADGWHPYRVFASQLATQGTPTPSTDTVEA
jgi:tRNA pseudouridine55 synthase